MVPKAFLEEPEQSNATPMAQKGQIEAPEAFFQELGTHQGGRPPKAAASLGVGGRRPPQVPGKRLLGPFFDLFGTIGVAFNCSGASQKTVGTAFFPFGTLIKLHQ